MYPNRIALYLGTAAAFCGGLAPVVANMDATSTAGVVAGVIAVATYVNTFVLGQQKQEERDAAELAMVKGDRDLHDAPGS